MDKELKELLDYKAIEKLMVHYADRVDANDPEEASKCFTPNGVGRYWGVFEGREAIAQVLGAILSMFSATSHHLTNTSITLNGDEATAMSYVYAFHLMADSGSPFHYWGRWVDKLVRTDEGWRFAEREVVGIGSLQPEQTEGSLVMPTFDHPGHPGRLNK